MNLQLKEKIISCRLCDPLGINYHKEREANLDFAYKYKPDKIKFLWIVESPPKSDPPRYFYRSELTRFDSLFRETMKVLNIAITDPKDDALIEFQKQGHFLIDSMKCPADKNNSHLKSQIRSNCSEIFKEEIIQLDPNSIIIIKADVYDPVLGLLMDIDRDNPKIKVLEKVMNDQSIPFPGSGQQVRFRTEVKRLLG